MHTLWRIFISFVLCLASVAHAGDAWPQYSGSPEANWTQMQREWIPMSKARVNSLESVVSAQQAFFRGTRSVAEAFPEYSAVDLSDPVAVDGLLVRLDDSVSAQFAVKKKDIPALGDQRRVDKVWAQRRAELDIASEVNAGRRKFLLGVRTHLQARPQLTRSEIERAEAGLRTLKQVARQVTEDTAEDVRATALRDAGRAEEELAKNAAVLAALRLHSVTGRPLSVDYSKDLQRVQSSETMLGARIRLTWMIPFLSAEDGARITDTLGKAELAYTVVGIQNEIDAVRLRLASATSADWMPERDVPYWTEQLATIEGARLAYETESNESEEIQRVKKELFELTIQEATLSLERLTNEEDVTTRTSEAKDMAADAQREAETARQAAQDAQQERTALLLEYRQKAQERATAVWEQIQILENDGGERQKELDEQIDRFENQLDALARPGLLRAQDVDVDETYREIRQEIERMRSESVRLGDVLVRALEVQNDAEIEIREELARASAEGAEAALLTDVGVKAARVDAIQSWTQALDGALEAVQVHVDVARALRSQRLRSLYVAQDIRKGLARFISADEKRVDRGNLLREAFAECVLAGPGLQSFLRSRWHSIVGIPNHLLDVNFMGRILMSILGVCVVLLLWGSGRRYGRMGTQHVVRRLFPPADSSVLDADRSALKDGVERLYVACVDLFASAILYWFAPTELPEVMFILLVIFEVALYRALLAIYDLASSEEPSNRPSLIRLGSAAAPVARATVSAILLWWVSRRIALTISGDLLNGYALERLVSGVFVLWFVVIVVVLLHRWNPLVRERIEQQSRKTVLVRWLSHAPKTRLLYFLQSIAGIAFLGVVLFWDLTFRLGGTDGVIGQVLNRVSRLQLNRSTEEDSHEEHVLPQHVLDGLYAPERAEETMDQRGDCLTLISDAIHEWETEGKRGLIAVLADSGGGKRSTMDLLKAHWDKPDVPLLRISMDVRLTNRVSMYEWLAHAFSLPTVPQTVHEAVALMSEHVPDGVFVLEQAHFGYLKTVGGFDGFRELIYVLNATSTTRCWLLVMHRPAWNFLSRLGDLINLSVFRTVRVLPGFSEDALRMLCVGRVKALGYRLDFTDIVRRNVLGADPAVELDRAISVFFRLLKEASAGNPEVALSLWAKSLTLCEERVLRVRIGDVLSVRPLLTLTEVELFTLVALRTQEGLSEEEIVAVTNMSRTKVRGTVKHLMTTGVLQRHGDIYRVAVRHIPAVDLTLRRRRFMQGDAA